MTLGISYYACILVLLIIILGLSKTDDEFGPYLYGNGTCTALPESREDPLCMVTKNDCDNGFHPITKFGCLCFCEEDMGETPVKMN